MAAEKCKNNCSGQYCCPIVLTIDETSGSDEEYIMIKRRFNTFLWSAAAPVDPLEMALKSEGKMENNNYRTPTLNLF